MNIDFSPLKKLLRIYFIIALVILTPILLSIISGRGAFNYAYMDAYRWRVFTKPVAPIIVQDLCQKLELPKDHPVCKPKAEVYTAHFVPILREIFLPSNTDAALLDEVQAKMGAYLAYDYCPHHPIAIRADGSFDCHFRLADRISEIRIAFDTDGRVKRVYARYESEYGSFLDTIGKYAPSFWPAPLSSD
ncbi:MAG: hypothetical protein OEZ02_05460 [Anaerolineae bacterium]|nr:hypothetical protein [Anaerolineae bacterium]